MLYPSLVMAVLACIVASQAVITGSFQVTIRISTKQYKSTTNIRTVAGPNHEIVIFPTD